LPVATPGHGFVVLGVAVVLEVAVLVELVAAEVLDVEPEVVLVAPELVLLVGFVTVDGVVTTELDGGSFSKMIRSTTVSASTPTTTPIAVQISFGLRTG
jgi:hypothetical protein